MGRKIKLTEGALRNLLRETIHWTSMGTAGQDGDDYRDAGTYAELVNASADILARGIRGGTGYPHIKDIIKRLTLQPGPHLGRLNGEVLFDGIYNEIRRRRLDVPNQAIKQFVDSLYL
jgi:hypothetical protein